MIPLRDVQEYSIEEENVSLDIKVLAPAQTKVEEELRQPLVLYLLDQFRIVPARGVIRILLLVDVLQLPVIVEFLNALGLSLRSPVEHRQLSPTFFELDLLPLHVNFPVFNRTVLRAAEIKV